MALEKGENMRSCRNKLVSVLYRHIVGIPCFLVKRARSNFRNTLGFCKEEILVDERGR